MRSAVEPEKACGNHSSPYGGEMDTVLMIASTLLTTFSAAYYAAGPMLYFAGRTRELPITNMVWKWTKWPAFANIFIEPVIHIFLDGDLTMWTTLGSALNALAWYAWRNAGDDEDWKKKMKDLSSSVVESIGHRLVVVPAPASS